jgi:hypothetical protein
MRPSCNNIVAVYQMPVQIAAATETGQVSAKSIPIWCRKLPPPPQILYRISQHLHFPQLPALQMKQVFFSKYLKIQTRQVFPISFPGTTIIFLRRDTESQKQKGLK